MTTTYKLTTRQSNAQVCDTREFSSVLQALAQYRRAWSFSFYEHAMLVEMDASGNGTMLMGFSSDEDGERFITCDNLAGQCPHGA